MRYINLTAIYPRSISIISAANGGDKCCFRFEGFDKREHAITAPMIGKDYRVINEFNNKFILSRMAPVLDNKTKHLPADPRYFTPYLRRDGGERDTGRKMTNFYSIISCFN